MAGSQDAVTVRAARAEDGPFLRALAERLVAFADLPTRDPAAVVASSQRALAEALEGSLAGGGTEALLVAQAGDGERLGCALVRREAEYFGGEPEAYVGVLAVAESAEGRGVGRALMVAVEAWARERGLQRLALEVFAGNAGARGFYRRLGYREDSLRLVKTLGPAAAEREPGR